ncbi:MAG: hypothetical protein V3S55_13920 [Nitrospiraceae bacterium]
MIIAMLVLLNIICYSAAIYFYRRDQARDKATLAMLLESHREERKCDQERIDSLVEALANSKGVSYVVGRGYSNELIPTQSHWGEQPRGYWDVPRPIVDHKEKEAD